MKNLFAFLVACACLMGTGANASAVGSSKPFFDGNEGWVVNGFGGTIDQDSWVVSYDITGGNGGWTHSFVNSGIIDIDDTICLKSSVQGWDVPVGIATLTTFFDITKLGNEADSMMNLYCRAITSGPGIDKILINDKPVDIEEEFIDGVKFYYLALNLADLYNENGSTGHEMKFVLHETGNDANKVYFGAIFKPGGFESSFTLTPEPASCTLLGFAALCGLPLTRRFRKK